MKPIRLIGALSALAAAIALVGCAGAPTSPAASATPTYVLVHGAFQDQRVWADVLPRLQGAGIKAVTLDLPGRANGNTPLESASLDGYRDAVLKLVNEQDGPVVLVGHSFGGITISAVAEAAPARVRTLVYLAAYLPQADAPDQSMAKIAETDQWNQFNKARQNFILAKDYKSATVLAEDQLLLFCATCTLQAQARTLSIMQREPLAPAATPVKVSAARFGRVDKVYIHTTRDNAVSYRLQQAMVARTPVRKALSLDTGHSPFVESPLALADALISLK